MMTVASSVYEPKKKTYDFIMVCTKSGSSGHRVAYVDGSAREENNVPKAITSCCHRRHRRTSCNNQRRQVSFIDEALAGHSLITHTSYRPRTTDEEKAMLHYNCQDYDSFALEELEAYCEEANKILITTRCHQESNNNVTKSFGWEDYMSFDSEDEATREHYCNDSNLVLDDIMSNNSVMHKVKTLRNLHV